MPEQNQQQLMLNWKIRFQGPIKIQTISSKEKVGRAKDLFWVLVLNKSF